MDNHDDRVDKKKLYFKEAARWLPGYIVYVGLSIGGQ